MQGLLCSWGVLSHLSYRAGQAQLQVLPPNLSDGGDEQESHSKLSKCGS